MGKFTYIKSLISPFKPFKLKWYCGKITIGTPYFYPRKWVKNPDKPGYLTPVSKKIGFDIVSLGWKTKYDSYRFEWNPIISFVFFKWQIAVWANPNETDHYWECWLQYEYSTDKTKSIEERLIQARTDSPQIWTSNKVSRDMWEIVLKDKYKNIKYE